MLYFGLKCPYRRFCKGWWKHLFNPTRFWRAAVYFWQRGTRGYADCDIWSLDMYLSQWLPSALEDLKDGPYPFGFTPEEWNTALDKMAAGFRAEYRSASMEYDFNTDEETRLRAQEEEGLKLFIEHYGSLWN